MVKKPNESVTAIYDVPAITTVIPRFSSSLLSSVTLPQIEPVAVRFKSAAVTTWFDCTTTFVSTAFSVESSDDA